MRYPYPSLQRLLRLAPCLIGSALFAQQTEESESDEQVFELDPFVVQDDDTGYLKTNQISGTRVNAAIKDTPINLEVIPSELLTDIGATSFKDSLTYSAGIFTESFIDTSGANPANRDRSPSSAATVGDPRNNAIIIRGFNAPFQQRLGFRLGNYIGVRGASTGQGATGRGGVTLGGIVDSVNIDRIEIVRGPGALLYGLGVISGIANIIPKEPLSEPRTRIDFGVGTQDFLRGGLDTTGPLLRREDGSPLLNYRFMAAHQEQGNWTDYYLDTQDYYAVQLKWYPKRGMSLFAEVQGGTKKIDGIGAQFVSDVAGTSWRDPYEREFRNEYGELYRWGRDDWFGPYPDIWDPAKWDEIWDEETWGANAPDPATEADEFKPLEGPPLLSASARSTGPDPYYQRDEWSTILKWNWAINENLAISLGGYHTEQDIEELTINARTILNSGYGATIKPGANGYDPKYDGYGFGVLNPNAQRGSPNTLKQYRAIGAYWSLYPTTAESTQFQGDLTYKFETSLFNATHSILIGRQEVKDQADLPLGQIPDGSQALVDDPNASKIVSFYNWDEPIRYDGQTLVQPGSDYYSTKLWYQGTYAVYHGKFFDEKFSIIGGLRRDRFEAYEEKWRRLYNSTEKDLDFYSGQPVLAGDDMDGDGYADNYRGVRGIKGVEDAYYNFDDAITVDTGSIGFTYAITDSLNVYGVMAEGVIPNTGVRDGNGLPIDPEQTLSKEIGLKFDFFEGRISGTISLFQIDRENAIWEYGHAPAPGKWANGRNPFQGNTGRLNPATLEAGAPRSYAVSFELYFHDLIYNDPDSAEARMWQERLGFIRNPRTGRLGVPSVRNPSLNEDGSISDYPGDFRTKEGVPTELHQPYTGILDVRGNLGEDTSQIIDANRPYVFIDYELLDQYPELREIMERAFDDFTNGNHPDTIDPIGYFSPEEEGIVGLNASANSGGAVTFEERAEGVDGQIIFSPSQNLQFIFSFTHIEREATTPFNLMKAEDYERPELGNLGTEYDIWVKDLGRENFGDPKDPSTLQSGIQGKSLYYGAEDTLSLWGKYTFTEGIFRNFGLGLGARYVGPTQTFIPIGDNLAINNYPTPDVEAYYQFDAAIMYAKKFEKFDFNLRLNLYNIFDKDTLYSEVEYQNVDYPDLIEKRRTIRYLEPFRIRLTASINF